MEGSLGETISRAPKMSPVEEKSSLASVQEDLHDYLTPGESRLVVAVEKNPLDYDSWMELLDVTEREGSHEKVVRLYERCLVPCAACADIWMRYVDFLEEAKMLTDASAVLSRALCFVEREEQLEICLFSARYKERIGDISGARQQYHEILSKLSPGSFEVLEALANMERRLGDDEKARSTYEDAIAAQRPSGKAEALPRLLVQYASFALVALKDPHKSRQILSELDGLNLTHAVIKAVINLASSFALNKDTLLLEFIDSLVQKFLFF